MTGGPAAERRLVVGSGVELRPSLPATNAGLVGAGTERASPGAGRPHRPGYALAKTRWRTSATPSPPGVTDAWTRNVAHSVFTYR